jgi:hypothetical protein
MSYVTRRVMLCPKCKGEMKIITSLKELGYVPFDWYELGDKVLDNLKTWTQNLMKDIEALEAML